MPIKHEEMIEEIEGHIRKFGGEHSEWCVGTAKDSRGPFFQRHLAADLGDGLAYREAYTTNAAQAVVAHLVNDRGLKLDLDAIREAERGSAGAKTADLKVGATWAGDSVSEAERRSALHDAATEAERSSAFKIGGLSAAAPLPGAVRESGKIVFVYRKTAAAPAASPSDQATLHKVAA